MSCIVNDVNYWLAWPAFLYTQDQQSSDATIHNGLGFSPSITNSESVLQACLQTDLKEAIS